MPLLHRRSSQDRTKGTHNRDEDADEGLSLFGRLRRRSSARSAHLDTLVSTVESDLNIADLGCQGRSGRSTSDTPSTQPAPTDATAASNTQEKPERSSGAERGGSHQHQQSALPGSCASSSHESRTSRNGLEGDAKSGDEHEVRGLSKDDVKHLFHGAPHFMLEKGRRGRYFPQAFFPWNAKLDITDLQDRRVLKHESFALATLHAHLPVPGEISWRPESGSTHIHETLGMGKRPMFDLSIYERPNMLLFSTHEPGTIGMCHYLESPVADGVADEGRNDTVVPNPINLESLSANEAFKVLAHEDGNNSIGKRAPKQDRLVLSKGGPELWKQIGIRDVTVKMIAERLAQISEMRTKVVEEGWRTTVVNFFSAKVLGEHLFSEVLYPPKKIMDGKSDQNDLKVQIKALAKVLTTPGAWLDFSSPEERLYFSINLHTRRAADDTRTGPSANERRHYALIQLLLSVELIIRVDAVLRLGFALHNKDYEITATELHHFKKLVNLKLDWDLVAARRFLDLCYAKYIKDDEEPQSPLPQSRSVTSGRPHLLDRFKRTSSFDEKEKEDAWRCAILPRQPKIMGEGVMRFAELIGWPPDRIDIIRADLISKLRVPNEQCEKILAAGVERLQQPPLYRNALDKATVELRAAHENTLGGPLSHAWLGGLVLPGYQSCDLLMCTLLENDPVALQKLGTIFHPRSGFILDGRSWWSKQCIACLVVAPIEDHYERMGWVGLPPNLIIKDHQDKPFSNGWLIVEALAQPKLRKGARIFDGDLVSRESSPLGTGSGRILGDEFSMVTDSSLGNTVRSVISNVSLSLHEISQPHNPSTWTYTQYNAFLSFRTTAVASTDMPIISSTRQWPLRYDVSFVGGHPCRPPHGHVILPSGMKTGDAHQHPKHKNAEHLPAHPLHNSFGYETKSLQDLLELDDKAVKLLPNPTQRDKDGKAAKVWIVDARGGWEREVVARAWCAMVGRNAVVARVGVTCIGCAIRECRAMEVGVCVRVGTVEEE